MIACIFLGENWSPRYNPISEIINDLPKNEEAHITDGELHV